jgi:hypothetical protein
MGRRISQNGGIAQNDGAASLLDLPFRDGVPSLILSGDGMVDSGLPRQAGTFHPFYVFVNGAGVDRVPTSKHMRTEDALPEDGRFQATLGNPFGRISYDQ